MQECSCTDGVSPTGQRTASSLQPPLHDLPWSHAHSHHSQTGSSRRKDLALSRPLSGRMSPGTFHEFHFHGPATVILEILRSSENSTFLRWRAFLFRAVYECLLPMALTYGPVISASCLKIVLSFGEKIHWFVKAPRQRDNDSSALNSSWALRRTRRGTRLTLNQCFLLLVLSCCSSRTIKHRHELPNTHQELLLLSLEKTPL